MACRLLPCSPRCATASKMMKKERGVLPMHTACRLYAPSRKSSQVLGNLLESKWWRRLRRHSRNIRVTAALYLKTCQPRWLLRIFGRVSISVAARQKFRSGRDSHSALGIVTGGKSFLISLWSSSRKMHRSLTPRMTEGRKATVYTGGKPVKNCCKLDGKTGENLLETEWDT